VRFALSRGLPHATQVIAHQVVPAFPHGPDVSRVPDPLPSPVGKPLPPPVIQPPIRGCDSSVLVTNVFDGALVTVKRSSGLTDQAGFDLDALHFILQKPLVENEDLTVEQEVAINCERKGQFSKPIKVGPLKPLDPPVVKGPLCAGATVVTVSELRPNALVHISADGKVTTGQAPPDVASFDFNVPPLLGL
jgi:hypothetical protein